MSEVDRLVQRFSSALDPSLVLAIAQEPGQSIEDAAVILSELAQAAGGTPKESGVSEAPEQALSEEATVLFLEQTFPNRSRDDLEAILLSAGDVDRALDELFVQEMLAPMAEPARGGLNYEALSDGLGGKKGRGKAKVKVPKHVTVSLTDQRSAHHIYYDIRTARSARNRPAAPEPIDTTGLSDAEIARRLQNAERDAADSDTPVADQQWLLTSSILAQLARLLDESTMRMQSLFHQSSFNLHVAVSRAIEAAAATPASQKVATEPEFATVCASFAMLTGRSEREARRVLLATQGHADEALDLLHLEDVVREAADGIGHRPDVLDPSARLTHVLPSAARDTPTLSQHRAAAGGGGGPRWLSGDATSYAGRMAATPARPSGAAEAVREGRSAVVLPASAGTVDIAAVPEATVSSAYSADECRARALESRMKRDVALRQAAQAAHTARGTRIGGAALVYAEEARKHDAEARRWQMRAASAQVDQSVVSGVRGGDRIDLHGLTVHEALSVVGQRVQVWRQAPLGEDGVRLPLEIVTGRGVHSRNHVSVVRSAVVRMLGQRGLRVDTSDAGVLYVKTR